MFECVKSCHASEGTDVIPHHGVWKATHQGINEGCLLVERIWGVSLLSSFCLSIFSAMLSPGGLVVKIQRSHHRGPGSFPSQGTIPPSVGCHIVAAACCCDAESYVTDISNTTHDGQVSD